jgi:uncharacterized protein YkwD
VVFTGRDHRAGSEGGARPSRRLSTSAALALAALTGAALTGCGGDGPASEVAAAHDAALIEVPTTGAAIPTGDDLPPDLLARVALPPSTTAAVPPSTAPPVTEPPTTAPPEPPTTEAPVEAVPEAVEPAAPPTTAAPEPEPPVPAAPGPWDAAAEADFVALLNAERAQAGLPGLAVDASLRASARSQVVALMDHGGLFHQDLHDDLAQGWSIVGENVGYGPNAGVIHSALVASPGHHANLVHTRYTSVGIGVQVDANGRMWVSQVFGG